jgi:transcriptional regulator with XRE-family HTH domain
MADSTVHELQLGAKLRRLREDRGLALAKVSEQTGLAESQLASFESDDAAPAVGDLLRIASSLGVSIGHFFQTTIPEQRIEVVRAEERWTVRPRGQAGESLGYRYHALSHGLTEKLMAPFLVEVPPGQEAAVTRSSHDGEEFLFVLAGRVEVEVAGEHHELGPGDAIYYDSRLPHSLRSLEGSTARLLACVAQDRRAQGENPLGRAYR